MATSATNRAHAGRMIALWLWSAGLAIMVSIVDRAGLVPPGVRPIVAIIPVVPLVAFFVRIVRWLRTLDEFQRMIHVEAMVMLAKAGAVPNVPAPTAFPFLWVRRKYQ